MSNYLYVNYTPVSTPIAVPAVRGAKNFIARNQFRGGRNLATSGAVQESVGYTDILISFTLEAMLVSSDYDAWASFAAWAIAGGTFILAPNYPISSKEYNCVWDGNDEAVKRLAIKRYSADFKFRMLNDGSRAANADEVMNSFWGLV